MSILQYSEHFQFTLENASINNDKQIKQKKLRTFFLQIFRNYQIFLPHPSEDQKLLLLTTTAHRSCYTLVRVFPTLSCFPFFHSLVGTNFRHQNKNNVVESTKCLPDVKKNILRILCV